LRREAPFPNLTGSMTTNPSAENQPQASSQPAPDFSAQAHAFWEKNRSFILGLCAVILMAIVGREGWEYYQARHEESIQEDFVATTNQPAKLAAFAAEHESHPLGGVAWLKLADSQYTSGDFKGAATNYVKAAQSLTESALKSRARLGAAMSQLASGDMNAGEAALKTLSADSAVEKVVRAEATYHLASLVQQAGREDEARKLAEEVGKIDATGLWAQRAYGILAALSVEQKPADTQKFTAPEFKLKP
jgi:predicted negative regulator of RcsB-dependent stress response